MTKQSLLRRTSTVAALAASALLGASAVALAQSAPSGSAAPAAGPTVKVSTAAQLTAALKAVKAGETIQLAAGTYSGQFAGTVSGTKAAPITLTGPATAILTNPNKSGDLGTGYGFHLEANYWNLTGFSADKSNKGIVLDHSDYDVLNGLSVYDIGDEGIHLREFSSYDTVENCKVHDTGQGTPGYGEGLYVGTSEGNWPTYTNGKPDTSNYDKILNNTVGPNVAAEGIDVKEATVGGTISGNSFNGQGGKGQNFSTDLVSVKGSNYTISGNTVTNANIQDGMMAEQLYKNSGCGNTFKDNKISMKASGYGFNIKDQSDCKASPNVVGTSNTVSGAGKGASSIPETPGV